MVWRDFLWLNTRSIISYAAPAWFSNLSDFDKGRLERIQRSATRTILPDLSYEGRLSFLVLPTISDFICDISAKHFFKLLTILYILFLIIYNVTHVECPLVSLQFIDQSYVELPNVPKHFFKFLWAFLTNNFFLFA